MMFSCLFVGSTFSSSVYAEQPDQRLLGLQKEGESDIFFKMSTIQFSVKIRCKAKKKNLFLVVAGKLEIDFLSKNNSCRSITAVTEKLAKLCVKCLGVCIQVFVCHVSQIFVVILCYHMLQMFVSAFPDVV